LSVEPLRNDARQIVGVTCAAFNITERKLLDRELEQRAAEFEHANRAKDRFLAALSHELRTPLAPVLMAAGALAERADLPQSVREDLAMIQRNVELEARLIDDLLDLTRIARGKLGLHPEPVDLHTLIRDVLESCCSSDINAKRQRISMDLQAREFTVWGDGARLQQILWNLIKNAVKFTPENGAIAVATRNEPVSGNGNGNGDRDGDAKARPALVIEVIDSGVGIAPEMLPRVFDAFEQGSHEVTRQFGGLGLGLAISKALVDLHGGAIAAHSDGHGRGAVFTIQLATIERPARANARAQDGPDTGRRLKILLVEDHEHTAEVLARLLRGIRHDVHTAATVTAALSAAQSDAFDVVISDLGLPDGSGLDLMRELKSKYQLRGIALSGYGMEEDHRRSLEVGFAAHLTKPVDFRKLQATIAQVVN
jgi:signal transduction histidine kinase